ncbi:hypothetical protein [Desulfuromonas thiophila]|uniref:hypothetical protein n=1 Tax=Desulfuromonas thiophila TaxID=57664 RepID=UPI0029F538F6|nr:hypothetical protein [Desulfuromonas thiophila]
MKKQLKPLKERCFNLWHSLCRSNVGHQAGQPGSFSSRHHVSSQQKAPQSPSAQTNRAHHANRTVLRSGAGLIFLQRWSNYILASGGTVYLWPKGGGEGRNDFSLTLVDLHDVGARWFVFSRAW